MALNAIRSLNFMEKKKKKRSPTESSVAQLRKNLLQQNVHHSKDKGQQKGFK